MAPVGRRPRIAAIVSCAVAASCLHSRVQAFSGVFVVPKSTTTRSLSASSAALSGLSRPSRGEVWPRHGEAGIEGAGAVVNSRINHCKTYGTDLPICQIAFCAVLSSCSTSTQNTSYCSQTFSMFPDRPRHLSTKVI